jgi:hydroxyacylglutathione hydrolase
MKAVWKKAAVASGVVLILMIAAGALLFWKFRAETGRMATLPTAAVADNVYAVQDGYVNLYLIAGNGGYVAIDGGNSAEHIRNELTKLRIDPGDVKAVFLTHTDRDHIAALALFGNAKIYISNAEEQMINGKTARFLGLIHNALPVRYATLEDGQTAEVCGVRIQGILTPGHTPGSMCYVVNGTVLFTGDTISLKDGRAELFNDFFNMDTDAQRKDLKRLKQLTGITTALTAHYGRADDHAQAFAAW